MYSYGSLHTAAQKQDDQHERTFSSCVRIQDVVLKTCLGRWTIGRSGERGSGISVLPARYDDDEVAQDAGLEFTRADVVVSISRGPPGQWFPETEYWASAIFVGTSGIPPKIIYRSVKSYRTLLGATTKGQSGHGSNGHEEVLRLPQNSSITVASPSTCLMSYPGHSLRKGSYSSVEIQLMYSTATVKWAGWQSVVRTW